MREMYIVNLTTVIQLLECLSLCALYMLKICFLMQVLSKDDPPRKTYVYKINIPVAAQWISLAVAPFEIFPDRHNNLITHICLPAHLSKLRNTVGFLHSAYRFACFFLKKKIAM